MAATGTVAADKPTSEAVRDFHTNSDLDGSVKAQHHTLGPNAFQASPGNHSHDGGSSQVLDLPLAGYTVSGSKTTGDLAFRNSITAALVKLGATDGTT
jgi:hypothetical protein